MLYDLNIAWSPASSKADLEREFAFLSELGYQTIALNHTISLPLPSSLTNPVPLDTAFTRSRNFNILRRCTLTVSDPTQNHRIPQLATIYDIVALRPTTEKALQAACITFPAHEFSMISLDLTIRYPFHFKPKPFMAAVNRGLRFEICYTQSMSGTSSSRATFISNVVALIRATSGRGLIISSEARSVLGIRSFEDVRNLAMIWGLSGDKATEGFGINPRGVVVNEAMRRSSHRGIIDIIDDGTGAAT